eukprot:m.98391 g.98391  ORF g.98391 m.98391 type:complete len:2816 (+) comp36982_c1_seq1:67-8514(+)
MRCHQVLTGAVNRGPCSFASAGEGSEAALIYASGCRVVILNRLLEKVQCIHTLDVSSVCSIVDCVHASKDSRFISASWSGKVYVFEPLESPSDNKVKWELQAVLDVQETVFSLCFTVGGDRLLIGSEKSIEMYQASEASSISVSFGGTEQRSQAWTWNRIWKTKVPSPVHQLLFSPDDLLFASLGKNDRLLKVWFGMPGASKDRTVYDFIYLAHPEPVKSMSWRQKSHLLPGGVLPNVLLTSCADTVTRFWSQTPNLDPLHMHQSIDVDCGFTIKADLKFHITATINPHHDIPLLPDVNRDRITPLTVHWLNNKTWLYNAVIAASLSQFQDGRKISRTASQHSTFEVIDQTDCEVLQTDSDSEGPLLEKPKAMPLKRLSALIPRSSATAADEDSWEHGIGRVLNDWRKTADIVFAVYPTDGSLLLWQIDHLDDVMPSLRLVHVSFSSRLPLSFPFEDAYSMTSNLVVIPQLEAVDTMSLTSPIKRSGSQAEFGHHQSNSSLARSHAFPSLRQVSFRGTSTAVHPTLLLFTRHLDGAVNLWNMELGDDPLRVTCVVHQRRTSGHRFDTRRFIVHSTLPLALSAAHVDEHVSDPDETNSELILWQTSNVSPLARQDGLHQLAIVNSPVAGAFSALAWIPASLFEPSLETQNELNGTLFVANEDATSQLFFHLAVVDAAGLLFKAHKSQQAAASSSENLPRSPTSLSSLDSIGSGESDVNLTLDGSVISTQSGLHPGCVIKMGVLDQTDVAQLRYSSLVFLHAFSGRNFAPELRRRLSRQSGDISDDDQNAQIFFIVAVTRSIKETTRIHLWRVKVVPPLPTLPSNRHTIPLPRVESAYLGAQDVELPEGVRMMAATAAADTKQSFFYGLATELSSYLFTTALSDGTVTSWACQLRKSFDGEEERAYEWVPWESGGKFDAMALVDGEDAATTAVISSPCCNLLACAHRTAEDAIKVSIWQGFSNGSRNWVLAESISVASDGEDGFALDWVSVEDGSYMLAIATQRRVELLAEAFRGEATAHDACRSERWCRVRSLDLDGTSPSICLAWTDAGTLIVARRGEMQLFSQWRDDQIDRTAKVKRNVWAAKRGDSVSTFLAYRGSLFEQASAMNPLLVQYHPDQLLELLNAGKLQRARAVLGNLVVQLKRHLFGGVRSKRALSWSEADFDSSPRDRIGFLGRVPSVTESPGDERKVGKLEAVPPLSLTDLLESDYALSDSSAAKLDQETDAEAESAQNVGEDVYSSLFGAMDDGNVTEAIYNADDETHDDDDVGNVSIDIKSGEFLPEHSTWLVRQLSQLQLPGLSSADQIRLLAVAETIASTQGGFSFQHHTALASASGAGYASISTADTSSIDDCGLRYLLSLRHFSCLLRSLPPAQRSRAFSKGLSTSDFAWAFHSDAEEELLSMVPALQRDDPTWAELKAVGVGWWVRSGDRLRRIVEKVAKARFQAAQQPLDAALFYLAMKKKSLLAGLFRTVGDSRMREFFGHDFNESRWRRAALKNGYALLGKQRFEHAAAFFLLGGGLRDAIEICINQLNDIQLALVIVRLYAGESENGPTVRHILTTHVLDSDSDSALSDDPFLRSLALWMLKDYPAALDTLLVDERADRRRAPAVFNFHLHLRNHPLLQRRGLAMESVLSSGLLGESSAVTSLSVCRRQSAADRLSGVGDEPLTRSEVRLLFAAAYVHLNVGCPMLSLDVLLNLPTAVVDDKDEAAEAVLNGEGDVNDVEQRETEGTVDLASPTVERDRSDTFDWSQPVGNSTAEDVAFDWSQPISSFLSESLNDRKIDEAPTTSLKSRGSDDGKKATAGRNRTCSPSDLSVCQQMKLRSFISVFMDQFRSLPFVACSKTAGQLNLNQSLSTVKSAHGLRFGLTSALNKEITSLCRLCLPKREASTEETEEDETKVSPTEKSNALKHFLYTLVHYCNLHGASGSGLMALQMESIILLQDLVVGDCVDQFPSHPNKMPPLCLSTYRPLPAPLNPFALIHSLTTDLLGYLVLCREFPKSSNPLPQISFIKNLTEQLSVCVLQSVLVKRPKSAAVQTSGDEMDGAANISRSRSSTIRSHLRQQLESVDSDAVSTSGSKRSRSFETDFPVNRERSSHFTESDVDLTQSSVRPTSLPSSWPGVDDWPTAMPNSRSAMSYSYAVLLAEATVAVYLALVVVAMSEHKPEDILLLLMNYPSALMWGRTFGGGFKQSASTPNAADSRKTSQGRGTPRITRQKSTVRDSGMDVFVPVTTTLMEHFLKMPRKQYNQGSLTLDLSRLRDGGDSDGESDYSYDEDVVVDAHRDPASYAWSLMRLAVVRTIVQRVKTFVPVSGIEIADLTGSSPLLHSVIRTLEGWDLKCVAALEDIEGPPEDLIDMEDASMGRVSLSKHKALFEAQNTPFRGSKKSDQTAKLLWQYLVRQETLHDLFIKYIFRTEKRLTEELQTDSSAPARSKLVHQENDVVSCFSLIKTNQNYLILSNGREILEVDAAMALSPDSVVWQEEAGGISPSNYALLSMDNFGGSPSRPLIATQQDDFDGYVMIHSSPRDGKRKSSHLPAGQQTGSMSTTMMRRPVSGVRRIEAHPSLPHYVSGSSDGTAHIWECGHSRSLATHKKLGNRILRVHFNHFGNKYGVATDGGKLHLFQFAMNMGSTVRSYQTLPCQTRSLNDFTFVSSSSFIASAGMSSDGRNVCLWDTLVPPSSALVKGFSCHDSGACVVAYSSNRQWLISGGRRGEICLFDVRQRCLLQKFTAHTDAIECLAIHDDEEFFVTGAADGDIKVFRLSPYEECCHFAGEHGRSSAWRAGSGMGVTQLYLTPDRQLLSSGADGTVKIRQIRI